MYSQVGIKLVEADPSNLVSFLVRRDVARGEAHDESVAGDGGFLHGVADAEVELDSLGRPSAFVLVPDRHVPWTQEKAAVSSSSEDRQLRLED